MPTKKCECGCGELAPIATRTQRKVGHFKGQPQRFLLGHHARGKNGNHFNNGFHFDKGKQRWVVCCRNGKKELWARIVLQNFLNGQDLPVNSVVHHQDNNQTNDKIENLQLIKNMGLHTITHLNKPVILLKNNELLSFSNAINASKHLGFNKCAVSSAIRRGGRVAGWKPQYL